MNQMSQNTLLLSTSKTHKFYKSFMFSLQILYLILVGLKMQRKGKTWIANGASALCLRQKKGQSNFAMQKTVAPVIQIVC